MVSFIVLFLPAVLTVWILEVLTKKELSLKQWALYYAANVLMINTVCFFVMYKALNWGAIILHNPQEGLTTYLAASYLIMAIPVAVFLGVVSAFLKKYIRIEIEEKADARV